MKAYAVIGSNFGDEGKGHITNYLSDENTLVVRFNGGAQAAHRVVLNDGKEHVFHHFGAGSLKGARTFFASHFLMNPLLYMREMDELKDKAKLRPMLIDPRCRFTTPYDMLINEFNARFKNIKNTVAVGINETVERSKYRDLKITTNTILNKSEKEIREILETIEGEYLPHRLEELNIDKNEFRVFAEKRGSPAEWDSGFISTAKWIIKTSAIGAEEEVIDKFLSKDKNRQIVFEGAQGLMLDQKRDEYYPYLTRSSTGLDNVIEALQLVKTPIELNTILTSRSYLTRHGDGPLWNELSDVPYKNVTDPGNPENPYQGKMRYAYLNEDWINKSFNETQKKVADMPDCVVDAPITRAVTCVDQLDEYNEVDPVQSKAVTDKGKFNLSTVFGEIVLLSTGEREENVEKVSNTKVAA